MKIGAFMLEIPEGKETDGGYVVLSHGQHYSLRVRSDWEGDSDVEISIDGDSVGGWRLEPGITYRIERSVNDPGKFTFYVAETGEAKMAGIVKNDSTGLISARFLPEKVAPKPTIRFMPGDNTLNAAAPTPDDSGLGLGAAMPGFSSHVKLPSPPSGALAGGTGLSGFSEQTFGEAARVIKHDLEAAVTINLRLIAISTAPRPLHRANPVPPPVG